MTLKMGTLNSAKKLGFICLIISFLGLLNLKMFVIENEVGYTVLKLLMSNYSHLYITETTERVRLLVLLNP